LYLSFALRVSSNWATTNNNNRWVNQTDASRQDGHNVNVGSVNGDYWAITGVQLEVGKNATEFEHRSYGEELALCQRYYYKSLTTRQGILYKGPLWETDFFYFPVEMRTAPVISGASWFLRNPGSNTDISYTGFTYNTVRSGFFITSTTSNTNTLQCWFCNAPLQFNAEL
jgi:hypothetical protein